MAQVYRALDQRLGRSVALKMLHGGGHEDQVDTLLEEAQALAMIDHPNVVSVIDTGMDRGEPYLVMELVEGDSLKAVVENKRLASVEIRLELLDQIAWGLDAVHKAGLQHRDVKLSNIVLRNRAHEHLQPVLVDFGLAVVSNDAQTQRVNIAGSAPYLAPEQILGRPTVRSDQYALAVVAWEMLTGRSPYRRATTAATILAHRDPPPPLGAIPDALEQSADVEAVLHRALNVDELQRFDNCAAFVNQLRNVLTEVVEATDSKLRCPTCQRRVGRLGQPCPNCGGALGPSTCTACQFKCGTGRAFCERCGNAMVAPLARPGAAGALRKVSTDQIVVAARLVGQPAPPDLDFDAHVALSVDEYGGRSIGQVGRVALALLDPGLLQGRGAHCAAELVEDIERRLLRVLPAETAVRCVITRGPIRAYPGIVAMGRLIAEGAAVERALRWLFGEGPQPKVRVDATIASALRDTHRLEPHEDGSLALLGERATPNRSGATPSVWVQLRAVRANLDDWVHAATHDPVLIPGPDLSGLSLILREVNAALQESPNQALLRVRCRRTRDVHPFAPLDVVVSAIVGGEVRREAIDQKIQELVEASAEIPGIGDTSPDHLAQPAEETLHALRRLAVSEPLGEVAEGDLTRALASLFSGWARGRSVSLLVDDLDFAAADGLAQLQRLARIDVTRRIRVFGTCELGAAVVSQAAHLDWHIGVLSRATAEDLRAWSTAHHPSTAMSVDVSEWLIDLTQAVPELLDAALDSLRLDVGEPSGRPEYVDLSDLARVTSLVGDDLDALFSGILAQWSPTDRRHLAAVAVAGPQAPKELVAALLGAAFSEGTIERLANSPLLIRDELDQGEHFSLSNAPLRDLLLTGDHRNRWRAWHEECAKWWRNSEHGAAATTHRIARHLATQQGILDGAEEMVRSGEERRGASAHRGAREFFMSALHVLGDLSPDDPEVSADRLRDIRRIACMGALRSDPDIEHPDDVLSCCRIAREDPTLDTASALEIDVAHARVLRMRGDLASAESLLVKVVQAQADRNEVGLAAQAAAHLAIARLAALDPKGAEEIARQFVDLPPTDLPKGAGARLHAALGHIARQAEDMDEARRRYQCALDIARKEGDSTTLVMVEISLANVQRHAGELEEALARLQGCADRSIAEGRRQPFWTAQLNCALTLIAQRKAVDAQLLLEGLRETYGPPPTRHLCTSLNEIHQRASKEAGSIVVYRPLCVDTEDPIGAQSKGDSETPTEGRDMAANTASPVIDSVALDDRTSLDMSAGIVYDEDLWGGETASHIATPES